MRLRPLDLKLLRDLWRMKWQALAIALLIACGVAVAVMAFSSQKALRDAQDRFYAETRFADVFGTARRAPLSRVEALRAIDGVAAVDARVVESGLMDVPGLERPAIARVISLPDDPDGGLNRFRLTSGRMPDPESLDEAVALKTFLDAAEVRVGDRLTAVIEGRSFTFTIVGAGLAPEFVFVPSPESFMPDDAHQGVFWAPRPAVEHVAGAHGAFNAVGLDLAAGASTAAVLQSVDRILAPYGGRSAYAREDQVSHAFLQAEFDELSTSASILPPIFLIVAAVLVHLVIGRLVDAEREQIGLLKAFGYSNAETGRNYLRLGAAIGLIGALAGAAVGAVLGAMVMEQYRQYFRFPDLSAGFHWGAFAISSFAAITSAMAGTIFAVRKAAGLSPAIAMQPPRPASYRKGGLDAMIPGASRRRAGAGRVERLARGGPRPP